jgi:hypothetical protein
MNTQTATQELLAPAESAAPEPKRVESRACKRSHGKAIKASEYCFRCALDFTPRMRAFHLSHGHLILTCQLCRTPLEHLGISRDNLLQGQFCSSSCKAEAERRGLCTACSKEPDGTFKRGACVRCRRERWSVRRQIRTVNGTLGAIRRAAFLPGVYHRCDRETA